jgi:hypothetical protein
MEMIQISADYYSKLLNLKDQFNFQFTLSKKEIVIYGYNLQELQKILNSDQNSHSSSDSSSNSSSESLPSSNDI